MKILRYLNFEKQGYRLLLYPIFLDKKRFFFTKVEGKDNEKKEIQPCEKKLLIGFKLTQGNLTQISRRQCYHHARNYYWSSQH